MGRPRKHDEHTRLALLRAAEALLSEGGADALSLRTLAERAGTTTRAVYSLFESKAGLWSALYQHSFRTLGAEVAVQPTTDDPRRDLIEVALVFRRFARRHPNLYRLAFERLLPGLEPTNRDTEVALESLRALKRHVERAIDGGVIRGRSVDQATIQFHAVCQGLASIEPLGWLGGNRRAEATWRDTVTALLHGLGEV